MSSIHDRENEGRPVATRGGARSSPPAIRLGMMVLALTLAMLQGLPLRADEEGAVRAARDRLDEFAASQAPRAVESHAGEIPSLPFLHANRIFLLSRLAAASGPGSPDPRLKRWLDEQMLAAISILGEARKGLPRGALGEAAEFAELVELSAVLDSLTAHISGIEGRLQGIRNDFAFHQSTELLIALAASRDVAAQIDSVHLRWNGYDVGTWALGSNDRASLAAGGYRPLHRAFARPESQAIDLELTMNGRPLRTETAVTPVTNRLTVLVLEVHAGDVGSRVWMP